MRGFKSFESYIHAPISYNPVSRKSFKVHVQKFLPQRCRNIQVHVIFLAGGPGGPCRAYDGLIRLLSKRMPIASYYIIHRGLDKSGGFTDLPKQQWIDQIDELDLNGPYPIKFLTLENAAGDVALLAKSIQLTFPKVKLALYGFSYGAQWAHQTVKLYPNLFHSSFMLGVPFIRGLAQPSHGILIQHCLSDVFCQSKIGSIENFDKALRMISNANYNECTKMLHDQLQLITPADPFKLTRALLPLLRGRVQKYKNIHNVQLVVPLIMATFDCLDPEKYQEHILGPLLPALVPHRIDQAQRQEPTTIRSRNTGNVNSFVNHVVTLTNDYDFGKGQPTIPSSYYNLHPIGAFPFTYHPTWIKLRSFLPQALTDQTPAETSKTSIFIAASMLDMITPPQPGWSLFNAVKAPIKSWLLFTDHPHDQYVNVCLLYWLDCGIFNKNCSKVEACVKRQEAQRTADWTFRQHKKLKAIWSQIRNRHGTESSADFMPKLKTVIANRIQNDILLTNQGDHKVNYPCATHLLLVVLTLWLMIQKPSS